VVLSHADILDGRGAVVEMDGSLDSFTSPDFEAYIDKLLSKNILFILFDATNMTYASSEGIGLLLFLEKRISETNGFFMIFNLSDEMRTLFGVLEFDKYLHMAPSRAEALRDAERRLGMQKTGGREEAGTVRAPAAADQPPVGSGPLFEERDTHGGTVVECTQCGSPVRVFNDAAYLCPHCCAEFRIVNRRIEPKRGESGRPDFGTLVIECAQCKSLVRVKKSGAYRCPDCNAPFTVSPDQSVVF